MRVRVDRHEAGAGDGGRQVVSALQRGQVREERPAVLVRLLATRDLDGESCLPRAAGTGERDDAVIDQQAPDDRDVGSAADEARALRGDGCRHGVERSGWREVDLLGHREDLAQRDFPVDVAQPMLTE